MASSCLMAVGELPSYMELALFVKTHRLCYRHFVVRESHLGDCPHLQGKDARSLLLLALVALNKVGKWLVVEDITFVQMIAQIHVNKLPTPHRVTIYPG